MEAATPELKVAEGGGIGLGLELLLKSEGLGPRTDAGCQGSLWGDFRDPRFLHVLAHSLAHSHSLCPSPTVDVLPPASLLQGCTLAEQSRAHRASGQRGDDEEEAEEDEESERRCSLYLREKRREGKRGEERARGRGN